MISEKEVNAKKLYERKTSTITRISKKIIQKRSDFQSLNCYLNKNRILHRNIKISFFKLEKFRIKLEWVKLDEEMSLD